MIQKLIERVSPERLSFVNNFRGHVYDLSTHPYGCRVLQRCLEHLPESRTHVLMDELHKHTVKLMQDQFGVSLELWVYERAVDFDCTYRTMSFNMFLNMVDNRTGRL